MTDLQRPKHKHPRGHCWNVMQHHPDPMASIARLETPNQCRAWLQKLADMDASESLREAVAERYQEVR